MKPISPITVCALALAACAPPPTTTPPTRPTPPPARPAQPPAAATPAPPAPLIRSATRDWHLLDEATDGAPGISVARAYGELLAGKRPARTVLVAIIDGGIDTSHVDLRANLWTNPGEDPDNGLDDDGNGYADDVHGWNFIGGANGEDVHWDTFEVTRLHKLCTGGPRGDGMPEPSTVECARIAEDYEAERTEAKQTLQQIRMIDAAMAQALPLLEEAAGTDSLTVEKVAAIPRSGPDVEQARQIYMQLAEAGITTAVLEEAKEGFQARLDYMLNTSFEPRPIVGDRYTDVSERGYGNRNVMGPDPGHGTHVAGIIGAIRDNGEGAAGIADAVELMMIRTVPEGDERDKDVANAIRYAVDNGALVINMSFGKGYSPWKSAVDEAVKYADSHGVLMVHAAGNDGYDLAREDNFPNRMYEDGGMARLWIEVGASSWRGGDTLAASFSNYGQQQVDVFAPGEDIYSTVPGGGYEAEDGTSMAAPVVTGLAALIMAYHPQLDASDVRDIILESATRHTDRLVLRPGSETGEKVSFGALSATGAVVNAYAALRLAGERAAAKR